MFNRGVMGKKLYAKGLFADRRVKSKRARTETLRTA
jgi:hypothetical protein